MRKFSLHLVLIYLFQLVMFSLKEITESLLKISSDQQKKQKKKTDLGKLQEKNN